MSSYAIPYVTTQSPRGERTVDIYSRLLADRIVYLGTGIDDGVANAIIAQLLHLENESPEAPVSLYINSPGG
jgi:ATP-dependent Clp protease protease subunit